MKVLRREVIRGSQLVWRGYQSCRSDNITCQTCQPRRGSSVEEFRPPAAVLSAVLRILRVPSEGRPQSWTGLIPNNQCLE